MGYQGGSIVRTPEYQAYMRSPAWQARRRAVIQRAGGKCEDCRKTKIKDVHHKTYARVYNEPLEDLEGLCRKCHIKRHPHMAVAAKKKRKATKKRKKVRKETLNEMMNARVRARTRAADLRQSHPDFAEYFQDPDK